MPPLVLPLPDESARAAKGMGPKPPEQAHDPLHPAATAAPCKPAAGREGSGESNTSLLIWDHSHVSSGQPAFPGWQQLGPGWDNTSG